MNPFSSEMLLNENYVEPTHIQTISTSSNLLEEAYDFVLSITNEMHENKKSLHKSILEANGNQFIITEAFDGFIAKAKKIIDKFLDFIKKIFHKFIIMINKLVKSDKYIKKHKDEIGNFEKPFEIKGYKYTFIDSDSFPNIKAYDTYKSLVGEKHNDPLDTGDKLLKNINATLDTSRQGLEDFYDSFRGTVMGTDSLTASEYNTELFEKFRNQESTKETLEISNVEAMESLNRFLNYEKTVKRIEDYKKKVERQYTNIKKELKSLESGFENNTFLFSDDQTKSVYTDNEKRVYASSDDDLKKKIDNASKCIIDLKINMIEKMCSIHAMAFSAKLTAAKECMNQDKTILYKALKKSVSESTDATLEEDDIPESLDTLEVDSDN